ncbi:hypothetical protein [Xanthomonas sp. LMG 12460]|uniref:DUF6985 domain-containing protein n=1 Tax=Xanthomonas sp. LMG 12460 TaxID=1591132 RepID=UPI0012648D13|nr:hypothetical protein [Xanthomonas sp. LMG 12460]KAB7777130.1 hypothetical protein CEK66_12320 [Xanthomonas sp. LMG 12460]
MSAAQQVLASLRPDEDGSLWSEAVPVAWMHHTCCFILEDCAAGDIPADAASAIATFLQLDAAVFAAAAPHVFAYYTHTQALCAKYGWPCPDIAGPDEIWAHVQFGSEAYVSRYRDGRLRISLECNCGWEAEHGLQLVFADDGRICKVGPFDGHLSHAAAHADPSLETVIYPT